MWSYEGTSHRFPIERGQEALDMMAVGGEGVLKLVVERWRQSHGDPAIAASPSGSRGMIRID